MRRIENGGITGCLLAAMTQSHRVPLAGKAAEKAPRKAAIHCHRRAVAPAAAAVHPTHRDWGEIEDTPRSSGQSVRIVYRDIGVLDTPMREGGHAPHMAKQITEKEEIMRLLA